MSSVSFYFKGLIFTEYLIFHLISVFSARLNASPFLLVWKAVMSTLVFALPLTEEWKWIQSESGFQISGCLLKALERFEKGIKFLEEITVILLFFYLALALLSSLDSQTWRRCSSGFACSPELKAGFAWKEKITESFCRLQWASPHLTLMTSKLGY